MKKLLVALLAFILFQTPVYATITFVQKVGVTSASTGTSVNSATFGSSITGGNAIFLAVSSEKVGGGGGTISGATDSNGNTYTIDASSSSGVGNDITTILSCVNVIGGASNIITVTPVGNSFLTILGAAEFSGIATSSPVDAVSAGDHNSGNANPDTGSLTTTNANDLIYAGFGSGGIGGTITAQPSGFIEVAHHFSSGTDEDGASSYSIVSSTQSGINPTWTLSTSPAWNCIGVAYKASAGGGGSAISKYISVAQASIGKANGVSSGSISKIQGVTF
jgi:hypothetical protein